MTEWEIKEILSFISKFKSPYFYISTFPWVTFHHLIFCLKTFFGNCVNTKSLMVGHLCRNKRWVSRQRVVDARVRDKICLKLIEVHIKGTIESERGCDRGYNLCDEPVEICVGRPVNCKVVLAQVIDCLNYHGKEGATSCLSKHTFWNLRGQPNIWVKGNNFLAICSNLW